MELLLSAPEQCSPPPAGTAAARSPLRPVSLEHLTWLLGSLCNRYRVPFDAQVLAQQFPPPVTVATLLQAAHSMGLKAGHLGRSQIDWQSFPLPAIAFLADDGASAGWPVLLVNRPADKLVFVRAGSQAGEEVSIADASHVLGDDLILVAAGEEEKALGPITSEPAPPSRFGFRWFIPELLKHKRIWRDVLLASFAIQLVGLAMPLFTQVIIDKVVVHQSQSTLQVVGIALVMFMLFTSAMSWVRQYLVLHTGNRIDAVLGTEVFRHLLRLPLPYFEHRSTGTLVARMHGVETIREFVSGAAVTLMLDLPFLLVFLAVMFAYSWELSLIAVGVMALIAVLSTLVAPVFRGKLNTQFLLGARNQAFLTEYVSGMATVKALQMEPDIERRYGDLLAKYLCAGFSTKQVGNTYNVVANALEQSMTLAILVVGAMLVMHHDGFTIGMLVAFQMFASRMSQPMLRLVGLWQEFQQANISVKRLGDILDIPQEPHTLTPTRAGGGPGRIEISGLGFRYSERHQWLYRNLDLRLKLQHLTVLMGPSGCGKSTLAKLLMGFYLPQEGRITLDGRDLRQLPANELRSVFGVVPQETVLFSGSVYDNLVMAHPHAGFEEVIAACKAAEIHDAVEDLPHGYQTELGEHGVGLSGGQRQRIAIARALLKKPKVLIFDEALSNLDQATSEEFVKTVNGLKGKVTILFITH